MTTKLTRDQLHEVAAYLEGSTSSLDSILEQYNLVEDDLTERDKQELYALVTVCETCGWWCSTDELNEESVCQECEEQ